MFFDAYNFSIFSWMSIYFALLPLNGFAELKVGVGIADITPPVGTPSAGSFERQGMMTAVHDPLLASAMVIDNGEKLIAFCSVDHMGFLREMVEDVKRQVHARSSLERCEIFLSSSHTHSGGGAYMDISYIGELIAGPYDPNLVKICVDGAANAIIQAASNLQSAKIGIGYAKIEGLTSYNGKSQNELEPPSDITVIKAEKLDGTPLAIFFNYSLYPDVMTYSNLDCPLDEDEDSLMVFSADIVGSIRNSVRSRIGINVTPIFFNGAKGELQTNILFPKDRVKSCEASAGIIAEKILQVWQCIKTECGLEIAAFKHTYIFVPQPTSSGYVIPIENYETEINLIVFNKIHAFLTIPAELSCSYDSVFKKKAKEIGFKQLSILDMVNDAHGYIYSPETWELRPEEIEFSFGGNMYGNN